MLILVGAVAGVFLIVVATCLIQIGRSGLVAFWYGLTLAMVGSALLAASCFLVPLSDFPAPVTPASLLKFGASLLFRVSGPILALCGIHVMGTPTRR